MIIDLKKYILTDLHQVKSNIKYIKDMKFDIIIINENGILSFIPCEKIEDTLLPLEGSQYIKNSYIYIDKSLINPFRLLTTLFIISQYINLFYG